MPVIHPSHDLQAHAMAGEMFVYNLAMWVTDNLPALAAVPPPLLSLQSVIVSPSSASRDAAPSNIKFGSKNVFKLAYQFIIFFKKKIRRKTVSSKSRKHAHASVRNSIVFF